MMGGPAFNISRPCAVLTKHVPSHELRGKPVVAQKRRPLDDGPPRLWVPDVVPDPLVSLLGPSLDLAKTTNDELQAQREFNGATHERRVYPCELGQASPRRYHVVAHGEDALRGTQSERKRARGRDCGRAVLR